MRKYQLFNLVKRLGIHLLSERFLSLAKHHRLINTHPYDPVSQVEYKNLSRQIREMLIDTTSLHSPLSLMDPAKSYAIVVDLTEEGYCTAIYATPTLSARIGYHPPRGKYARARFAYQVLNGEVKRAELSEVAVVISHQDPEFVLTHSSIW